jgi:hypothetical protein
VEKNFFVRHYDFILDVFHIALFAFLIFFMHFARGVQIGSLIVAALVVTWLFNAHRPDEAPCGSEVSGEPVARSRGGFAAS